MKKHIEVEILHASARHSGNTKHYALALISIKGLTNGIVTHHMGRTIRTYGGLGKPSRPFLDEFVSGSAARREFDELIKKKVKGGYAGLSTVRSIFCERYTDIDAFMFALTPSGSIGNALYTQMFTQNLAHETISAIFESDTDKIKTDLIEFAKSYHSGSSCYEVGTDENTEEKKKEAKLAAAAALEAKRIESYGDTWGSW